VGTYKKRRKKQKGSGDERNKKISKTRGASKNRRTRKQNPSGGEG
jgi:hypothetical protein